MRIFDFEKLSQVTFTRIIMIVDRRTYIDRLNRSKGNGLIKILQIIQYVNIRRIRYIQQIRLNFFQYQIVSQMVLNLHLLFYLSIKRNRYERDYKSFYDYPQLSDFLQS